eukprot:scaffold103313_cov16-Tisochrysis_lutea.AAC.1
MEAHLVMASQSNPSQLAIIAILYEYGEADPFVARLEAATMEKVNAGASFGDKGVPINLAINVKEDLLPKSMKFAGYDGSMTTPPCSEVVKWHVFLTPRTISLDQMKQCPMRASAKKNQGAKKSKEPRLAKARATCPIASALLKEEYLETLAGHKFDLTGPQPMPCLQSQVFSDASLNARSDATITNSRIIQSRNGRGLFEYSESAP